MHEEHALAFGLDSLGYDRHLERVSETDDRTHNGAGLFVGTDSEREAAIDLDLVERKRLQRRQRRIAFRVAAAYHR
jgi:hypothetical protein